MAARAQPLPRLDLLWIGLTAVAVRVAYLAQIRRSPLFDYLHLDPLYYVQWGRRVAAGEWIGPGPFEQSPLYPYGLGLFFALLGERLLLLRLLQFALGAATCVGIALIARSAFDRRVGLAAGLLAAVYGPFPFYEGQVMKSFLKYVLITAALACVYRSAGRRRGWLAAAGASIGLLALVRDNALLLAPALALWVVWNAGRERRRPALAGAAALLAGTALTILPATLHNAATGEPVLITSGGGEVFYIGNWSGANGAYLPPPFVRPSPAFEHEDFRAEARRRSGDELSRGEASRFWFRAGLAEVARDPIRWACLEGRKLALFWNARELPDNYSFALFARHASILRWAPGFGILAPLALVGMALTWRRWRPLLPLHLVWAVYMLSVLAFFNFSRFRLPAIPALLPFAAAALVAMIDAVRERRAGRALGLVGAVVLLAIPLQRDLTSPDDAPGQEELLEGWALLEAGRAAEAEGKFAMARRRIEAFHRVAGAGADSAERAGLELGSACFGLGSARLQRGDAAGAVEPLQRAAGLDPRNAAPQSKLAQALRAAGRPGEAEAALRRATEVEPGRFAHWFDLASLAFARGDAVAALDLFEQGRAHAAPLAPLDRADYHFGVALVHLELQSDREAALPHLRQVLELAPSHAQADAIRQILREP